MLWPSAVGLVVVTTFMGIGHIMLMASQQMLCVRAAKNPRAMELVFGNYMVAGAIGQGAGPYIVGWAGGSATVPPTHFLFTVACVCAVVSFLVSLTMRPRPDKPKISPGEKPVPVASLLRTPGLLAVIVAGVIMISASDIILIYVPLLGRRAVASTSRTSACCSPRAPPPRWWRGCSMRAWSPRPGAGR